MNKFLAILLFLPVVFANPAIGRSPVVVELFTSQGCSSCPRADELISRNNKLLFSRQVYFLAFHVTYWDYLGWPDPYGQEAYTQRQRQYADSLNEITLFTPQFRINGGPGFADHNGAGLKKQIAAAQQRVLKTNVSIDSINFSQATINLGVSLSSSAHYDLRKAELNIAVTEDHLSNNVPAGENRGRLLTADGVVQWFTVLPLKHGPAGRQQVSLVIPVDRHWIRQQLTIIAYVQNNADRQITGAAAVKP